MSSFKIDLAEITVEVHPTYDGIAPFFKEYYSDSDPAVFVHTTQQEIEEMKQHLIREDRNYNRPYIDYSYEYVEKQTILTKVFERLPEFGAVLIHGSAFLFSDNGYIFVGPSGVGKSTHTRLWREHFGDAVQMINDDKPILALRHGTMILFSSPWQGKHNIGSNISGLLKGIVVLEQGEENVVRRLSRGEALPYLLQQVYKPSSFSAVENTLEIIDHILHNIDVYFLSCKPETEAVVLMRDFLI